MLEEAATAKTFDEPNFAAGYALAAIPARWALERRDWKAAAELEPPSAELPWERFPYAPAITYFAQAIGAARTGRLDAARAAAREAREDPRRPREVAGPRSLRLGEPGRVDAAGGRGLGRASRRGGRRRPLKVARSAAELEEKTGKHPVTPGAILPARELLGDMLLEIGRPAEALAEYEASLREAPNRFNSLYGAARAAELAKKPDRAREFYAKLLENSGGRHPDREEIKQARDFLEKTKS